eukprot:5755382-Amphidinium_carterae.2
MLAIHVGCDACVHAEKELIARVGSLWICHHTSRYPQRHCFDSHRVTTSMHLTTGACPKTKYNSN